MFRSVGIGLKPKSIISLLNRRRNMASKPSSVSGIPHEVRTATEPRQDGLHPVRLSRITQVNPMIRLLRLTISSGLSSGVRIGIYSLCMTEEWYTYFHRIIPNSVLELIVRPNPFHGDILVPYPLWIPTRPMARRARPFHPPSGRVHHHINARRGFI